MPRPRGETGQVSLLIIGFFLVLLLAVATVVDASAAFLQRQSLDSLADGAALRGADLGSVGTYQGGVPEERLEQVGSQVHEAVSAYLVAVGADQRYPGLRHEVLVDRDAGVVRVTLRAPLELPLRVPGVDKHATIGATGSAAVTVQR
ncbi:Tad domain-containing protein [Nocardioides houyundeii]|uniref:Tad domain-containing protein n=1 Tax=Nocardioides houyundeii TaxID=2045452 RepID=UPI000C76C142|nr:Tad domain-containing protein [Nocardioides houyundeii]